MDPAFTHRIRRKGRKLVRDPGAFISDMIQNRVDAAQDRFWQLRGVRTSRRYSVVSAVYGVEAYLDDFFRSLEGQTVSFSDHIELIMVDDGSRDSSAAIIKAWQAKYPDSIRYLKKENGGQASARNHGIPFATGDWITFIDPDDFVDIRYFERVDRFLDSQMEKEIAAISCNFIVYEEATDREVDRHPLKYRFARGNRVVEIDELYNDVQLSANSVFFQRELLERQDLRFDERIRPNFEDAHFVNRYLLSNREAHIAFLADAKYYYRKRSDENSTLDLSWEKPGLYGAVLRHGCLDLIKRSIDEESPYPPRWIQRAILYHLVWYVKKLLNDEEALGFLSKEKQEEFHELFAEILKHIEVETIDSFNLGGIWLFHKLGLLNLRAAGRIGFQHLYLVDFDEPKRLLKLRYFISEQEDEEEHSFFIDGKEVFPLYPKTLVHRFAGRPFLRERTQWLYIPEGARWLKASASDAEVRFVTEGRIDRRLTKLSWVLARLRGGQRRSLDALSAPGRVVYKLASMDAARRRYGDAFLFMDRDTQADDNAEHLYRYTRAHRPDINAFFVLNRDSHDWERLEKDGFRLLAFGSLQHRIALLHAKHLISSHIDNYVVTHPIPSLTPHMRAKISFLQHGVTKDNLSSWLNTKEISLLVACSPREYQAFIGDEFGYKFTPKEVVLSGFPRHDRLIKADVPAEKRLLIMPTWRQSLAGPKAGRGNTRLENPKFYESEFARRWKALVHSEELESLSREHGYQLVFFPHANLEPYLQWFEVPDYIELKVHNPAESIQSLFLSSSMLITDYSSVAFEMAYLKKPVFYYQFDRDEVFSGAHFYSAGYFDYDTDGFGPVCAELEELVGEVRLALNADGMAGEAYRVRMEKTFAHRDGRCCERTLDAILALDEPAELSIETSRQNAAHIESARRASQAAKWESAARRWRAVLELSEEERPESAAFELLEALRQLGQLDEAASLLLELRSSTSDGAMRDRLELESAELASALGAWERAIELWESALARIDDDAALRDKALLRLAQAYRMVGQLDEATQTLAHIREADRRRDVSLERAALAFGASEWSEAARHLRHALSDAKSREPKLVLDLAEALINAGEAVDAEELINEVLRIEEAHDAQIRKRARALRAEALGLVDQLEPLSEESFKRVGS